MVGRRNGIVNMVGRAEWDREHRRRAERESEHGREGGTRE